MRRPNGALVAPSVLLFFLLLVLPSKLMAFGSSHFVNDQQQLQFTHIYERPDPLTHFRSYTGGYNVTNIHYWASAVFTGVHGYAIALVWLSLGIGLVIFLACKHLCCCHQFCSIRQLVQNHYRSTFLLIIIFTVLAIVATSLVLLANERTLRRTEKFKGIILKAGKDTHRTIHKLITIMTEMQQLLHPYDIGMSMHLYSITHILADRSQAIQTFIKKIGRAIDLAIHTWRMLHLVVVTINLLLLIASLVLLVLHWQPGFITVIIFCWILTTLCWTLTGADFFLHTFAEDTCTTLQDFEQNPQNSSLSSLLPCMDSSHSDQLLAEIGYTIHDYLFQMHIKIREFIVTYALAGQDVDLTILDRICDPFSGAPNYSYSPDSCPKDAITIGDLVIALPSLTCFKENSTATCMNEGRIIPETYYYMARAYGLTIQDMFDIYPDVASLVRCSVLKTTFSDVVKHQCRPFRFSVRFLWASMLCLSIFMVLLVSAWVLKAYQDKGTNFSRWSITPDTSR